MLQERNKRPIIVCGVARSGTTFLLNMLNEHPDIVMSDEFFIYKTPSLVKWFDEWNKALPTLAGRGNHAERKIHIMRTLWFYSSQDSVLKKGMISRRFGNKTPGSEHYIDFYESVFENSLPLYIYVLREGQNVFLSVRNTDWGKNAHINGQLNRYIDSIKVIESFQKMNPERVKIIQLDRIDSSYEARLKATRDLFDFIGEKPVDEILRFIEIWKPAHTTQQVRRKNPEAIKKQLPEEDLDFLSKHDEYQRILKRYAYIS